MVAFTQGKKALVNIRHATKLMSDRALCQAVGHFHLISDSHVLFLNNTHRTSVIKITLEKVSL